MILQPWHWWVILAVVFAIAEIFTPGFVLLCFAAGAAAAAVMAAFSDAVTLQVLTFAAATLASFVTMRPLARRLRHEKSDGVRTNLDRLIGESAVALEQIDGRQGSVKVGGEEWSARSDAGAKISSGSSVRVVRIDGNKLIVG